MQELFLELNWNGKYQWVETLGDEFIKISSVLGGRGNPDWSRVPACNGLHDIHSPGVSGWQGSARRFPRALSALPFVLCYVVLRSKHGRYIDSLFFPEPSSEDLCLVSFPLKGVGSPLQGWRMSCSPPSKKLTVQTRDQETILLAPIAFKKIFKLQPICPSIGE